MSTTLSPVLVGREEDARALRSGLQAALGGAGRVFVLLGEAGVGKSRLALELATEARRHCTVLTGRAVPGSGSTGLRAFADALQPAFRTRRPPDADEIRPFVAALARLVRDWRTEAVAAPSDPVTAGEGVLRLLRLRAGEAIGGLFDRSAVGQHGVADAWLDLVRPVWQEHLVIGIGPGHLD